MEYILILGAFQALIALGLVLAGRTRKPADHLLSWTLACMAAHLSIKFIIYAFSNSVVLKAGFNTFIDLAYGPLLWMYAKKVKNDAFLPAKQWFLFLPTLLAAGVYMGITYGIVTGGVRSVRGLIAAYNSITDYLILLSFIVYPLLVLRLNFSVSEFWDTEKKLIRRMSLLFLVIPVLWALNLVASYFGWLNVEIRAMIIRVAAYSSILVISLSIIRHRFSLRGIVPQALLEPESPLPVMVESVPEEHREELLPRKSFLAEEQRAAVAEKLLQCMEKTKVYTDPDLTLEKLASLLKIPRNQISEVLNQYMGKTFYQFVNEFRVKEIILLLNKCKKQGIAPNILSLAFEAGFNSKSSFNQYFKKTTGKTPSEYLREEGSPSLLGHPSGLFTSSLRAAK